MRDDDPHSLEGLPEIVDRYAQLMGGPARDYLTARLPEHGDRAVDLGSGTGQHAAMLANPFTEVLAVDTSEAMINYANTVRPRANITYERRDLRDVSPERDGRFDLVLSAYALHDVDRLGTALRGIRDLVAPGGQVILIDSVDARRRVPRSWFAQEAVRRLAGDVLHHRRLVAEAVEVFRLSVQPAWLDQVSNDVLLAPDEFAYRYLDVFPDAEITRLYRARALHWKQDPSSPERPFPGREHREDR